MNNYPDRAPVVIERIESLIRSAEAHINAGMPAPAHVVAQLVKRRGEWVKRQDVPAVVRRVCDTRRKELP
jgi:hypothetical protein